MTMTHTFADGKYTVTNDNGKLTALRHGEPWGRDLIGDNLVYWMLVEVDRLKREAKSFRWNIDRDGDDILVCFDHHDKGAKCEYVRFTRATNAGVQAPAEATMPRPAYSFARSADGNYTVTMGYDSLEKMQAAHRSIAIAIASRGAKKEEKTSERPPYMDWLGYDPERGDIHGYTEEQVEAAVAKLQASRPHLDAARVAEIFKANCVFYSGNYEVTPGQANRIAAIIEGRP